VPHFRPRKTIIGRFGCVRTRLSNETVHPMPLVTFDGQSFTVRNRKVWLIAAGLEYALTPRSRWAASLAAARRAGFNAIVTGAPWVRHESAPDRFDFTGDLDVAGFARECAAHELMLIVRMGPSIGGTWDGGGLPAWIGDVPEIRVRQRNPAFLDRVTRWYRALAGQLAPWQATDAGNGGKREPGPIIAVQIEDAYFCGGDEADRYLDELQRFAREVGFTVPTLTANRLHATADGAIDVWDCWSDALATGRQLAVVSAGRPRLTGLRHPAGLSVAGTTPSVEVAGEMAGRLARALASGAQFFVLDAFAERHRGATAGNRLGDPSFPTAGFLAPLASIGSVFGERGVPRDGSGPARRLVSFASGFAPLFLAIEPGSQPTVLCPDRARPGSGPFVVPIRGSGGEAVFVFRGEAGGKAKGADTVPLLLRDGRVMPVRPLASEVSWFVFDADLGGNGTLNEADVVPVGLVARSIVVFCGVAGTAASVRIDGQRHEISVPAGDAPPAVVTLKKLAIVVCNERQADAMLADGSSVVFGAETLSDGGVARLAPGFRKAIRIDAKGTVAPVATTPRSRGSGAISLRFEGTFPERDLVDGTSDRYATIRGPRSLAACGGRRGYGWYRLLFRRGTAGSVTIAAPSLADRATLWLDGKPLGTFGNGPGAEPFPLTLKLSAGEHRLVALVESLGRPTAGDLLGRPAGLPGPIVAIEPLKGVKAVAKRPFAADPFALGAFRFLRHHGETVPGDAATFSFLHKRKTAILLQVPSSGATASVLVNGKPAGRIGAGEPEVASVVVEPARFEGAKPGAVEIAIVPDDELDVAAMAALVKQTRLFECVEPLGGEPRWAFASWMPPVRGFPPQSGGKGGPTWTRASVRLATVPASAELELGIALDGSVLVNGHQVVRTAVGESSSIPVPAEILREGDNLVEVFTRDGAVPKAISLRPCG
jgi:hypothetical protein